MGRYTDYLKEKQMDEAIKKYRDSYASDMQIALSNLLKQKDFRFFLSDILGYTNTFKSPFDEKGNLASFNAGKQAVGLKIFNDIISIEPNYFIMLTKEEGVRAKQKENIIKEALKDVKN